MFSASSVRLPLPARPPQVNPLAALLFAPTQVRCAALVCGRGNTACSPPLPALRCAEWAHAAHAVSFALPQVWVTIAAKLNWDIVRLNTGKRGKAAGSQGSKKK